MSGVFQQPADFRDESEALHGLLEGRSEDQFSHPTRFKGWTTNDVIGHLYMWNRAADQSIFEPEAFAAFMGEVADAVQSGGLRLFEQDWRGDLAGQDLRAAWREHYLEMADRLMAEDPKRRVRWAGPDMSIRSSVTARLMETWAHGQEVYDSLGVVREDADRIGNIAILGVNTFGWTFVNRGLEVPPHVPHVRLVAPSGAVWEWNADNDQDRIEGTATEFCQVVCQTRNIADTELEVSGDVARRWMDIAQCFAGRPEDPPPPGFRRCE